MDPALFSGYSRILAGVSGGSDSLALLMLLMRDAPVSVEAVHFEHGLRGTESRNDAAFVLAFCAMRSIPCRVVELDVPRFRHPGENLEAAARRLRLEAWRRIAAPGDAVALGHHAGDVAENMLLRLARGANVSGLSALRPVRRFRGLTLLRPLLRWSREELRSFLLRNNVMHWCEDATNADGTFLRNFLRNELLPALYHAVPHAEAGFRRANEALLQDAAFIEQSARRAFAEIRGKARTERAFWRKLHPALCQRVARYYLEDVLACSFIPDRRFAERFARFLATDAGSLPIGAHEWRNLDEVLAWEMNPQQWVWPEPLRLDEWEYRAEAASSLPETADRDEAFFDADALPAVLELDERREGERFLTFGRVRSERLSQLGVRRGEVVLRGNGVVLWVPGKRHGGHALVTAETRRIVRIYRVKRRDNSTSSASSSSAGSPAL